MSNSKRLHSGITCEHMDTFVLLSTNKYELPYATKSIGVLARWVYLQNTTLLHAGQPEGLLNQSLTNEGPYMAKVSIGTSNVDARKVKVTPEGIHMTNKAAYQCAPGPEDLKILQPTTPWTICFGLVENHYTPCTMLLHAGALRHAILGQNALRLPNMAINFSCRAQMCPW